MPAPTMYRNHPSQGVALRGRGGHCPSLSDMHYINYQFSNKNLDTIYQIMYNVVVPKPEGG